MTKRGRIAQWPGLERNVLAASTAVFLLFLGEELWKKFLPRYLEALGAGDPGREIQQPMAVVILGGIVTSTFLNMIVIPALYLKYGEAVAAAPARAYPYPHPGEGEAVSAGD